NNAGILKTGSLAASSVADWEDVARVNVSGMLACSFAVLPHMTERSYGKIVNVASVSALRGSGAIGNALYAASKAAVVALTKGFASEFGPRGVNVNAVAPAVAETAMTEGSLHSSAVRERTLRAIPMGRFATGCDVGNVAAFLASDVASYMSGSIVVVDGGYLTG
ncbi:MAG: SDR family oxidoreductase, partial [bacterium]|nr:SDR family oxidoreductase [bacterium]